MLFCFRSVWMEYELYELMKLGSGIWWPIEAKRYYFRINLNVASPFSLKSKSAVSLKVYSYRDLHPPASQSFRDLFAYVPLRKNVSYFDQEDIHSEKSFGTLSVSHIWWMIWGINGVFSAVNFSVIVIGSPTQKFKCRNSLSVILLLNAP